MTAILTDAPSNEDCFERQELAKQIAAQLIISPVEESVVYGLEARWGEGKTTLIKFIEKELLAHPNNNPLVIHFNPWTVQGVDSLIREFVKLLIDQIKNKNSELFQDTSSKKIAKLLDNFVTFGELLTPLTLIPQAAPFVLATKGFLGAIKVSRDAAKKLEKVNDLSLLSYKKKIDDALVEIGQPIIVFIDDIDRLAPSEVQTVFQMVKAVCNFRGISYFLSYDPEPVAKALSYEEIYNGQKYIEKIVQQIYQVPRADYLDLKVFLSKNVDEILNRNNINLREFELSVKNITYIHLTRLLKTPRDVIRLVNKFSLYITSLKGEVNIMDVLAFLAIDLQFPKIAKYLRENPEYALREDTFDQEIDPVIHGSDLLKVEEKQEAKTRDNKLKDLFDLTDQQSNKYLAETLYRLFPSIRYGSSTNYDSKGDRRLQVKENWIKFLRIGTPSHLLTDRKFKVFMESSDDRNAMLSDMIDESLENFPYFVSQLLLKMSPRNEAFDYFLFSKDIIKTFEELDSSFDLLEKIMKKVFDILEDDYQTARDVLNEVFTCSLNLHSRENIITDYFYYKHFLVRTADSLELKAPNKNNNCVYEVIPKLIDEIKSNVCNLLDDNNSYTLLYRWGQYLGSFNVVNEFLLSLDKEHLKKLIVLFQKNSYKEIPSIVKLIGNIEAFIEIVNKFELREIAPELLNALEDHFIKSINEQDNVIEMTKEDDALVEVVDQ